jgi:hypothetical protein
VADKSRYKEEQYWWLTKPRLLMRVYRDSCAAFTWCW